MEVVNVSIRYITGDFKEIGLKEFAIRKMTGDYHIDEFWANRDISFSMRKGDMLGIIGKNGAGKSTLLKAVSGIMEPTKGRIICRGNVVALLELASGFDRELTVKENAYLRGAMLGYTRDFMNKNEWYGDQRRGWFFKCAGMDDQRNSHCRIYCICPSAELGKSLYDFHLSLFHIGRIWSVESV